MRNRTTLRWTLAGAAGLALIVAGALLMLREDGAPLPGAGGDEVGGTPDPQAEPTRKEQGVTPVRIVVSAAQVDAEVIEGAVDREANQMIAPAEPDVIAWYRYSALPGDGGNAILSGHVDFRGYGPAVLWHLGDVEIGDTIEIELSDGTLLTYRVQSNEVYRVADGPWQDLFAQRVGGDVITLYTCDGAFVDGAYDSRRVVRATKV